jgi:hypothetical protein
MIQSPSTRTDRIQKPHIELAWLSFLWPLIILTTKPFCIFYSHYGLVTLGGPACWNGGIAVERSAERARHIEPFYFGWLLADTRAETQSRNIFFALGDFWSVSWATSNLIKPGIKLLTSCDIRGTSRVGKQKKGGTKCSAIGCTIRVKFSSLCLLVYASWRFHVHIGARAAPHEWALLLINKVLES